MDDYEGITLCAASAYEEKYYFNPEFSALPEAVQQELQIACVIFTQEVGGILTLVYLEDGTLELRTGQWENDFSYDEIGSVLKIKELQREKAELFESLELFFRTFYLG